MISTGFVNSIKRGCRQLCGRRIYFFAMTVIPIVLAGFLLGLMRNGLPLHIPTAIVNHDNTESTRKPIRNIKSSEEVSVVSVVSSEAEAMQLIRKGKNLRFLRDSVQFHKRRHCRTRSGTGVLHQLDVLHSKLAALPQPEDQFSACLGGDCEDISCQPGAATDTQAQTLLQPVVLQTNPLHNPESNYSVYLCNSFIPTALALMILLVTAYSIWHEEKMQTSPQWIKEAHGSITIALLGKLLPQTVVFAAVGVFMQSLMYGYLHFPLNCSPWQAVGTMLLFVLANQGFAVFISGIMPNLRMALSFCSLFGILTFSIGAFSFPLEDMYGSIAIFSYILPVALLLPNLRRPDAQRTSALLFAFLLRRAARIHAAAAACGTPHQAPCASPGLCALDY